MDVTKDQIKTAMEMFDDDDTPDGAYWGLVANAVGLEISDVWDTIMSDMEFFDYMPAGNADQQEATKP